MKKVCNAPINEAGESESTFLPDEPKKVPLDKATQILPE